jgi:hypothetical protein
VMNCVECSLQCKGSTFVKLKLFEGYNVTLFRCPHKELLNIAKNAIILSL